MKNLIKIVLTIMLMLSSSFAMASTTYEKPVTLEVSSKGYISINGFYLSTTDNDKRKMHSFERVNNTLLNQHLPKMNSFQYKMLQAQLNIFNYYGKKIKNLSARTVLKYYRSDKKRKAYIKLNTTKEFDLARQLESNNAGSNEPYYITLQGKKAEHLVIQLKKPAKTTSIVVKSEKRATPAPVIYITADYIAKPETILFTKNNQPKKINSKEQKKSKKSYMDSVNKTKRYAIAQESNNSVFSMDNEGHRFSEADLLREYTKNIILLEQPQTTPHTDNASPVLFGAGLSVTHKLKNGEISLYTKEQINERLPKKITNKQYQCLLTMEKTINSKIKNGSTRKLVDFIKSHSDGHYNLADAGCTGANDYVLNNTELKNLISKTAKRFIKTGQAAALKKGIDIYKLPFSVALASLDLWYQGGRSVIFGDKTTKINSALKNGNLYAFLKEAMYGSNGSKRWQTDIRNFYLVSQITELLSTDSSLTYREKIIGRREIRAFKKHISRNSKALKAIKRVSHLLKKTPNPLNDRACLLISQLLDDTNWRGKKISYQLASR